MAEKPDKVADADKKYRVTLIVKVERIDSGNETLTDQTVVWPKLDYGSCVAVQDTIAQLGPKFCDLGYAHMAVVGGEQGKALAEATKIVVRGKA